MRRRAFFVLAVLACGSLFIGAGSAGPAKIKVLIVTGCDVGAHKWYETTPELKAILVETGRFDVRVCEDPGILESKAIGDYDLLVLNYMNAGRPSISAEAKKNLLSHVDRGTNLLCFHFSTAAFTDWDDGYIPLIGRAWRKGSGHGPRGKFMVHIEDEEHPITKGMEDFETDDELYAKLVGDKPIHVLASAKSEWSGAVEPLAFTHTYGKGRVYTFLFGHDVQALRIPAIRKLFARGAEWAATGGVKD
ncbi:MAG: ThuA domain-containing protein [Planctomycetes bacterium]|nr:ThuA domain-containing protein [Planctomycetota bacterium]